MSKTCTMLGCDKTQRARGLCSTHYNQAHQPNRHVKVERACDLCGDVTLKESTSRFANRFCSETCRDLWRLDQTNGDPMVAARAARKPSTPKAQPTSCLLAESACHVCGVMFFHRPGKRVYCSKQCRSRGHDVLRKIKGRKKIRRVAIFERDNYICWMCEKACDPAVCVPHPCAPTIDHLTPQSLGGTHEPENLATACFMCNSTRGASWNIPTPSAA